MESRPEVKAPTSEEPEHAELILELQSRHPGIKVPHINATHRSQSPANHPPQADTDHRSNFQESNCT
jgi:hypothetical protein